MTDGWKFSHNRAAEAEWHRGLREIFEYRDLGIKDATAGDYVAHVIRANGRKDPDDVQRWHRHHCKFQFVMILRGWAEFEYEGEGTRRLEKGDVVNQRPGILHREIACSDDLEILEIVSPSDFATEVVD
ncbi:MAG: cupin domain-containing protein [Kiloniellales bacterium]|nr:cupin domain-containing protein [Kiloniellales bacterium]